MIIYKVGSYLPKDSMSRLICDNYPMLLVMSRFGIDLGFGDDTIEEVCAKNGVDLKTFLAVVNLLIANENGRSAKVDYEEISLQSMILYLHNSHSYFLKYRLPSIRTKLIDALQQNDDSITTVIVNYYDEYVAEVHKHMMYEENVLFPYIKSVIGEHPTDDCSAESYSKHHDKVEAKLSELKSILIKYYPAKSTNELNSVLYDIFLCERDLASHNDIEDHLLVPAIKAQERLCGE